MHKDRWQTAAHTMEDALLESLEKEEKEMLCAAVIGLHFSKKKTMLMILQLHRSHILHTCISSINFRVTIK